MTVENQRRVKGEEVNCDRPQPLDVALYIQYLVQVKQGSRAIINGALAAITDHIKYIRTPEYDPCNSQLVQHTRDVLLPMTRQPEQKKELMWEDIQRILKTIKEAAEIDVWIRQRDSVMILLAYTTLLRGSEVVRMKVKDIEIIEERSNKSQRQRRRDGAYTNRRIMKVYVNPLAKNDAERKGHTRMVEEDPASGSGDLVYRMNEWMETQRRSAKGKGGDEWLFPTVDGEKMHEDTPRGRLKIWLTRAQFSNTKDYGFHSLRAGGATDAAKAGASERDIQRHGNWKSNIVQNYIRQDEDDRLRVSQLMNNRKSALHIIKQEEEENEGKQEEQRLLSSGAVSERQVQQLMKSKRKSR